MLVSKRALTLVVGLLLAAGGCMSGQQDDPGDPAGPRDGVIGGPGVEGPEGGSGSGGASGGGEPAGGAQDSDVDLALTVGGPALSLPADGPIFSFGDEVVGTTSAPRTIALTNSVPVPVTLDGLSMESNGAFAVQADGCTGASLMPSQTCVVGVAFAPTQPGEAFGGLRISVTARCAPSDTWQWCDWQPNEGAALSGQPIERVDLAGGETLIRYAYRSWTSFQGSGTLAPGEPSEPSPSDPTAPPSTPDETPSIVTESGG